MAKEYYVFATEAAALTCVGAINGTEWFPLIGYNKGQPAPDKQQTTNWVDAPTEMASGEWCIERIPESQLDYLEVPQAERDAFLAAFGQDIRVLTKVDFPQVDIDDI